MEIVSHEVYCRRENLCTHFPSGYVKCVNYYNCTLCELADRLRNSRPLNVPLFDWRDALPQTPAWNAENWYKRPVILSPDAMRRLGIELRTINQIMIAYDGPGVFKKNVAGEIDGFLLCDKNKHITVTRSECFGIPTQRAAARYDELYLLGLSKLCSDGRR